MRSLKKLFHDKTHIKFYHLNYFKVYSSVVLSTLILLHTPFLKLFSAYKTETLYPLSTCHSPVPQPHSAFWPYEVGYSRHFMCKYNHVVAVFVTLISLSIMPSRCIHVVACARISFLLKVEWYFTVCTLGRFFFFKTVKAQVHLRPIQSELLGVGSRINVFTILPRGSICSQWWIPPWMPYGNHSLRR